MSALFQRDDEPTIVYASPDGKRLKLTLFQKTPESTAPLRPAVVLLHGGGWSMGTRHQLRWYGRALRDAGYVAIGVQYRLMPLYAWPHCLHDCKAAVRWLRQHANELHIDTTRIIAMGASAGGHLAAMIGSTPGIAEFEGNENPGFDSHVNAVISFYAPCDLKALADHRAPLHLEAVGREFLLRFVGATPGHEDETLLAASPIHYLTPKTPPTLIIHGSADQLVPLEQSQRYYEALKTNAIKTQLCVLPDQMHGFDFFHPSYRPFILDQITTFLTE